MSETPKALVQALELVTKRKADIASIEALGVAESRHITRVRSVFDDPNVIGAGIAQKETEGAILDDLSICFYVKKKVAKSKLDPKHILPQVIASPTGAAIFTDVVALGTIRAQVNKKNNPVVSGFSVGHVDISAGTIGAIVRRGKKRYLLSNSHVLANSGIGEKGDDIVYPGVTDGGKMPANHVAKLSRFVAFKQTEAFENEMDAALAEVLKGRLDDLDLKIKGANTPLRTIAPKRGMRVIKRGRTTGDTASVVRDTNFSVIVDYGDDVGRLGFRNQVLCGAYTERGDSGSLIIEKESGAIVGLHFCGSPQGGVFTPIKTVMEALKFKF